MYRYMYEGVYCSIWNEKLETIRGGGELNSDTALPLK